MWGAVNRRFPSVPGMGGDKITASESVVMADDSSSDISVSIDISSSTDSSPRHSFDEYSSMRLDIDRMTYEELLALGESIGHVCTGIPENLISECLTTKKCSISDQNQGRSCAICLEAYKIKVEIGAIKKCGHDYHASCIKKWLLMKNVCPICKCTGLLDLPKHE